MPVIEPTIVSTALAWTMAAVPNGVAALVFVLAGFWLSRLAERALLGLMDRQLGIDPTLRGVLGSTLRYAVLVLFVLAAIGQLGFQTSSILAVLATAGLAVGLALQATLANIAAGIMLLWLRPFRVGDLIEVGPVAGKVVEVGLFATEIHTVDGVYQFVPNSELWNKRLVNFSRLPHRLVAVRATVANAEAVETVRHWLATYAAGDRRVLADPKPAVAVAELAFDKIVIAVQAWTSSADFRDVQADISDKLPAVVSRSHRD